MTKDNKVVLVRWDSAPSANRLAKRFGEMGVKNVASIADAGWRGTP